MAEKAMKYLNTGTVFFIKLQGEGATYQKRVCWSLSHALYKEGYIKQKRFWLSSGDTHFESRSR
jgi:hypothetical protein